MECKGFLIEFQNYLKENNDEDFEIVVDKLNDILSSNKDKFELSSVVENLSSVQFSQSPHEQANKDLERFNEFNYTALDVSDTSGDGFFESLSVCLFGNTSNSINLRFKTLEYMCQNYDNLFHVRKNLDYSPPVKKTILDCSNGTGDSNVLTFWCASKALGAQIVNIYPPYNGICDKKFNFMPRVFSPDTHDESSTTCFLLWYSETGLKNKKKTLPLIPKSDFKNFGDHIYCSKSNTAKIKNNEVRTNSKHLNMDCDKSILNKKSSAIEDNSCQIHDSNQQNKGDNAFEANNNTNTNQNEDQSLSCLAELLTSNTKSKLQNKRSNDGLFGLPLASPKQMCFLPPNNLTPFSTPNTILLSLDEWSSKVCHNKENNEQNVIEKLSNITVYKNSDDLIQNPLNTSFKDPNFVKHSYKEQVAQLPDIPELDSNVNSIDVPYREFQSKEHLIDYMLNTPCTHTFLPQHAPHYEQFLVPKSQIEFSKFCGPWTRLRHHKSHSKKYAGVWVMVSHFVHTYCGSKYRKVVSKLSTGKMLYQFEGDCPDYIRKMQTYSTFAQKTAADTLLNSAPSKQIKADLSNCHIIVEGDVDSLNNSSLIKGCRFDISSTRNYHCVVEKFNGNYNAFFNDYNAFSKDSPQKNTVAKLTQQTYSSKCCEFYKRIVFTLEGCSNSLVQFVGKKPQKCHCGIKDSPVPFW